MKKLILLFIIIFPLQLIAQDTLVIVYKGDTIRISQSGLIGNTDSLNTTIPDKIE